MTTATVSPIRPAVLQYPDARHYIGGQFHEGGPDFLEVHNPAHGRVISRVPLGGPVMVDRAATAAERIGASAGAPSSGSVGHRRRAAYLYHRSRRANPRHGAGRQASRHSP